MRSPTTVRMGMALTKRNSVTFSSHVRHQGELAASSFLQIPLEDVAAVSAGVRSQ